MAEEEAQAAKSTKTMAKEESAPEASTGPKMEEEVSFKTWLCNCEKGECMGRNCMSWFLIFVFYVIFFAGLACFFMLSLYASLTFLNDRSPYRTGWGTLLFTIGPGFSQKPTPDREANAASTLIWVEQGPYDTYNHWSKQLKRWFEAIPSDPKKTKECVQRTNLGGKWILQQVGKAEEDKPCRVEPNWYGPCSLEKDPVFGYDRAELCILLKLNRIYDWRPHPWTYKQWMKGGKLETYNGNKLEVPKALRNYIKDLADVPDPADSDEIKAQIGKHIMIWCDGEFDHDKEILGSFEYFPGPFIPAAFFPFLGQDKYQSPFVMLQLKRPVPGTMISILCRAFARNIEQKKETNVGYLRFQVMTG